jgi:hypothetical protein
MLKIGDGLTMSHPGLFTIVDIQPRSVIARRKG